MPSLATAAAEGDAATTACFSIHARAEPGVMPRLIELFAKRGMVPALLRSAVGGPDDGALTVEIQMRGLGRELTDYIAACMRQIACVEAVLTAEQRPPAAG